ncbi:MULTISPECIES: carbonic anhydrase [Deefgea]|uniref:carbonic anhydrase n=1 Tax=Deefgea chitinilytica TaxID=570276 RepID=A0ABS2C8P3_9NEIS|nr:MULTISPECIES: carbonic anhydrase family protein [Deefgea]MBM5570525.1 carbonate dehydratase [Deefgea chitinilytica]MBM9887754.1 carbonic anhydrase family protein [Deefgea sp. CFH1-16]
MHPTSRALIISLSLMAATSFTIASEKSHSKKTAHDPSHWSYEGETGPSNWGSMKAEFGLCSTGKQQSPVNITEAYAQDLDPLQFQYQESKTSIQNNGHTIQLNYDPGSYLIVGTDRYQLLQFHFHTPSEEAIGGQRYPMVAHLVHKNDAGQLAVVALLINQGSSDNEIIQKFWEKMPSNHNETRGYDQIKYNVSDLLPNNRSYWTLMGSLTTPPCSEGVRWLILKNPLQISAKQIARFKKEFPMNARPIQSLQQRAVLDSN